MCVTRILREEEVISLRMEVAGGRGLWRGYRKRKGEM